VVVYSYGLPNAFVTACESKNHLHSEYITLSVIGSGPIWNENTGTQVSFYDSYGHPISLQPNVALIDVKTGLPITVTMPVLPVEHRGKVINWLSMSIWPKPVVYQFEAGYEVPPGTLKQVPMLDYQSQRIKAKVQSTKFAFEVDHVEDLCHVYAIRLLRMKNIAGDLEYIDGLPTYYSLETNCEVHQDDVMSLYKGGRLMFSTKRDKGNKFKVIITFPSPVTVSAFDFSYQNDGVDLIFDGRCPPTNVKMTFLGVDGTWHVAGSVSDFIFPHVNGAMCNLRLPLHDEFNVPIETGIKTAVMLDSAVVKLKIRKNQAITLVEYLMQFMIRSSAIQIVKLIAGGKTLKAISKLHPEVPYRFILLAFAVPLLKE